MDVVIDIQFCKDHKNRVVPKEVAVVALNQDFIGHWIVSSNNRVTHLCDDARKQNDWLTQHHHGLDWTDTGVTLKVLYKNLEEICKRTDKIYVCGNVKTTVLRKITTRNIKNLETDPDCPPFHKLLSTSKYCVQHFIKLNHFKYTCALNNAFKLKTWINSRKKSSTEEFIFEPPISLCDEQYPDPEHSNADFVGYRGGFSSRSDTSDVVETGCLCA